MTLVRPPFALVFTAILAGAGLVGCSSDTGGNGEKIGESSAALGFTNDKAAFDYFVGKGLTGEQAAGIVGNLDVESGVDPDAVQSGGPGRGIAQWLEGGRWDTTKNDNAASYASEHGEALHSLQAQLDFLWYELTSFSGYGLAALKETTTVTSATESFTAHFEGCSACDSSLRVKDAEYVFSTYGSDTGNTDAGGGGGSTGTGTDDAGATSCTVTTTGDEGECITTTACAALGNHVSTPGFCPGADDIECCTATDGTGGTGGTGGTVTTSGSDGGSSGSASGGASDAGKGSTIPVTDGSDEAQSSACSTTGSSPADAPNALLLAGVVLVSVRRKKRVATVR